MEHEMKEGQQFGRLVTRGYSHGCSAMARSARLDGDTMTTTIQLNAAALTRLIDSDPEFGIQLKKIVLAEIVRGFFRKDMTKIIAELEPDMFKLAVTTLQQDEDVAALVRKVLNESTVKRDASWAARVTPTEQMRELIAEEATKARNRAVAAATTEFNDQIAAKVAAYLVEMEVEGRVEKRVERLTNEYIERMVDKRFKDRLAELAKTRRRRASEDAPS